MAVLMNRKVAAMGHCRDCCCCCGCGEEAEVGAVLLLPPAPWYTLGVACRLRTLAGTMRIIGCNSGKGC